MGIPGQFHFGCTLNSMKAPMGRIEITKLGFMEWGEGVMPMACIGCGVCVDYGILRIIGEFFRNIGVGIHKYTFLKG